MTILYGMKMKVLCINIFFLCLQLERFYSEALFENSLHSIREPHDHEKATLACECGKQNKVVKKPIPWKLAVEIYNNEIVSPTNSSEYINYIMEIKQHFKNCSVCEVEYSKCPEDPNSLSGYSCYKNSVTFEIPDKKYHERITGMKVLKKRSMELPVEIEILPGTHPQQRRIARQTHVCAYPTSLATAEIRCRVYPSSVSCVQMCALGYTLKNGTQQERYCFKNTNRWIPCSFEECKPYVDCGVTLVCGGAQTCTTPTCSENVRCNIRCDRYEDKSACPERVYECDTDGRWTPPLPFCVVKGSGLQLVSRPRN
ncbi:hypothetical protein AVEN_45759-1 [Araneus ventricosus]|uniref:Sushi domain-containing protein n=1 Tax=Araneus ventricosus TaxID=182803 RepID=A0A4Y2KQZ8_ARAVE|nr:hypothetical protein AVEN_45759-1 [Araneus ventricosus]